MKIKNIDYGYGFCVNNGFNKWIEINKNLKRYPKLYNHTLKHEKQHFKSKNSYMDFWLDFKELWSFKFGWEYFKFSLRHPKSFLASSPIFFENRRLSVNWFMLLVNIFIIILAIGGIMLI